MNPSEKKRLAGIYPACMAILGPPTWNQILERTPAGLKAEDFPDLLPQMKAFAIPGFLPELARLERSLSQAARRDIQIPSPADRPEMNPTVRLFRLSWKNLPLLCRGQYSVMPEPGEELVLAWKHPRSGEVRVQTASDRDLLALKMAAEKIELEAAAAAGKTPVHAFQQIIEGSIDQGILIAPASRLRRCPASFPGAGETKELYLSSPSFTLQWHITQACDLHCRHCYDRNQRPPLPLDQAVRVLDDLLAFCRSRHVKGQVTFTGGHPFLHPDFPRLYREAAERGLAIAILGNPTTRERLEEIRGLQPPLYYQVSLEGLPEHNDSIRGAGQFTRVMEFLGVLRDLRIYSMVMLTLTKENLPQVLPLAEILRGKTDVFCFNRLSRVGEGARLELPAGDPYRSFLEEYLEAARTNPILSLKDNLMNIVLRRKEQELFGGCTGFGCGAAFNFLALLPDGEVHACRKFPSPLGNVFRQTIADIYDSELAERYRAGSEACRPCALRPVCGGCLAVAHSHGLNVFLDRDPYCFMGKPHSASP